MNVCCANLLSNELIGFACRQTRSSDPRARACMPDGKGMEEEGVLSNSHGFCFLKITL